MNAPPDDRKRNARVAAGVSVETEQQTSKNPSTFRVVVDGTRIGMPWREYSNEGEAQAAAAGLRRVGMAARVERAQPELGAGNAR
jgi:hypothetical protein